MALHKKRDIPRANLANKPAVRPVPGALERPSNKAAPPASKAVGAPQAAPPEEALHDLLDLRSIERLARLLEESGLAEIEVQDGEHRRLRLSRRSSSEGQGFYVGAGHPGVYPPAAGPAAPAKPEGAGAKARDPNVVEFVSPMVGSFYRAPSPEAGPYVTPGDKVGPETVICIIEAMKVMNEIKAEVSGEVVDVLVENGEAVEYGQPLFLIRRSV